MADDNSSEELSKNVRRAVGVKLSNGKNKKFFKLLYCASIDSGDPDVERFHLHCDSKAPTLTILHGKHNAVFGGYTSILWSSSKHHVKKDTQAFLFYMNDNEGALCKFFPVKDNKTDIAITCDANFGPTFGAKSLRNNYDLQVFKKDSKPESKRKEKFLQLNGVFDIGNAYNTNDDDGGKVKSNDINSGKLIVKKIEVFHVLDDEYPKPWRTQLEDEQAINMKEELEMKEPIPGLGIKKYNMLLIGTIGVGKSSFYNTLATVFADRVKTHAPARESVASVTNEVKAYTIATERGEELCVRIIDIRGFQSQRGYEHELALILNGQLRIGYKFPEQMSEPTEEDKRNTETLDDEIHLLCFLTGPPENYNTDQIQEIDNIKHITDLKGLPMVVVATKFDEQCLNVMEDVDHLYKCKKSKETTEDIAIFFKIQENHVLPVVNYTSENVKSKGKDILALQALYKMIEVTEDFLAKHPDRQRPIQATQEVDDRRAPEEVMEDVEEQGNNDVQTSVDGHQTSEPSLSDRLNSKSYRPPKDTCIFDGRLIKLGLKDIADLEKNCIKPIGDGAFGKVFTSNSVSDGFGMHVAVKKIPFDKPDAHSRSIRREMITSRIMHPFILPLLAVVDLTNRKPKPEFWFVSPFCKKGDLHEAIEKDHIGQDNVRMNEKKRIRILLQIALAIQYIHTKVPDVRDIVLHKDISSKNVVLDDAYNARLIDFGLAREKDDQTTDARGRICYSPPDIGRGKPATESWDYYMFAVIIREILTGLGPQGINNKFLKNMEAKEVLQKLEKRVWIKTDRARYLNDIAEQCLQQNARTVSEFNTTVVERINAIWTKDFWGSKIHQVPNNYAKCHICMINPKARETSMTQKHAANCRQKIEVCIACEKNSSLNPITCYCGTKLTPLIGSRCGALLVAGNDTNNKSMAKALAKDIEELKKLITSQAPRIMGISEDKVRTVIPSIPDKPDNPKLEEEQELWPKVKEHIRYFSNETEIDTLLIYFSCHDASNMGTGDAKNHNVFRFGSASDNITLDQFEDELESLENIDKLIIFLDRCFPPLVRFKKRDRKFIQINACKQDEMADITDSGSVFTKYLIQGLKAKSERKKCSDSNCQHCDAYWSNSSGSDFISVSSLFDYVKKHMEAIQGPLPVPTMQIDFQNIAFYTDEEVIIEFTCEEEQKRVPLEYLQNMELLQDTLYEVFKRDKSTTRVRIQRDTYRKDDRFVNCETLKTVMSAWIHRQPLTVTFETSPS